MYRELWRVQDRSKINYRRKGKAGAKKYVKEDKHLEIYRGLREDIGVKTYLHAPNGRREKDETAISRRGPGPTRKKGRYQ